MKLIIISPNTDTLLTQKHLNALNAVGDVVLVNKIRPIEEVTELYEGDEPRVVAIDPDFSDWTFPNEVIDKIPNLKAICLQTTDFSWVDAEHAAQKGIIVTDLHGFSSIAVAEWATFMTLAVARRLPLVIKDGWKLDYNKHQGFELRGKTAGIIGLGRIGTAIAENMAGLGMKVQYWSKHSKDDRFNKISLEELLKTSDVILPATAGNAETRSLVSNDMMETIRPTAVVVSIVDPIYNKDRLIELVQSGKIGGFAYEDEKGPMGKHDGNIWNGPALGWCTKESMEKNADQWVESIVNAANGEHPTRVN